MTALPDPFAGRPEQAQPSRPRRPGRQFRPLAGLMRMTAAFCMTTVLVAALQAGTITGTVKAHGPEGSKPGGGGDGNYQSRRYKFVDRVDYSNLTDFVVYIDQPMASNPSEPTKVVQKDANFEPHVLPIAVGTVVRWPNEDDIYHNVFSMSDASSFDLGLYTKEKVPAITFDKLGRVDVFCSIHSRMHCIILVLPNNHFAKVDFGGRFTLKDVPPGKYRLRAWHERLPSQVKEIEVPEHGEARIDFDLGLGNLPKY